MCPGSADKFLTKPYLLMEKDGKKIENFITTCQLIWHFKGNKIDNINAVKICRFVYIGSNGALHKILFK